MPFSLSSRRGGKRLSTSYKRVAREYKGRDLREKLSRYDLRYRKILRVNRNLIEVIKLEREP